MLLVTQQCDLRHFITHTSSDKQYCQLPAGHYTTASTHPVCNTGCQIGTRAESLRLDLPRTLHHLQLHLFELEATKTPGFSKLVFIDPGTHLDLQPRLTLTAQGCGEGAEPSAVTPPISCAQSSD